MALKTLKIRKTMMVGAIILRNSHHKEMILIPNKKIQFLVGEMNLQVM
jgi:hypothetical protein